MSETKKNTSSRIVALIVILLILYTHSHFSDVKGKKNAEVIDTDTCVNCDVTPEERIKIENVIKNYKEIRGLKKSKRQKLVTEIVLAAARGGIGGIVLGGEAAAFSGMIVLGSVSGILTWVRYNMPDIGRK